MDEWFPRIGIGFALAGFVGYQMPNPESAEKDPRGFLVIIAFFFGTVFFKEVLMVLFCLILARSTPYIVSLVKKEIQTINAQKDKEEKEDEPPRLEVRPEEPEQPLDILRERFRDRS